MESLSLYIGIAFIIGFLLYQMMKSHVLSKLSKAMQKQEYDIVLQLLEKTMYRRLIGAHVCDLYALRALLNKKDETKFKEYLMETLNKPSTIEQRKDILDIYYYHFIFKKDKEMAALLLDKIREMNDMKYLEYNQEAYDVMINKQSDMIEDMIQGVENKKYSGLGLGIALFMIGMQYIYVNNKEEARVYFYNSLSCFNQKSFYYAKAKTYVDQLSEELGAEALEY